jgi:hypothetical protein
LAPNQERVAEDIAKLFQKEACRGLGQVQALGRPGHARLFEKRQESTEEMAAKWVLAGTHRVALLSDREVEAMSVTFAGADINRG